jgi:cytochrome P450
VLDLKPCCCFVEYSVVVTASRSVSCAVHHNNQPLIGRRRKQYQTQERLPIASCVLLCHCRLTEVEITDNLLLVLLAGFDTSSTTLTAVLANLQQHPAAVEQLHQEQQAVMDKHGPDLSAAVLRDMPYANAVIR